MCKTPKQACLNCEVIIIKQFKDMHIRNAYVLYRHCHECLMTFRVTWHVLLDKVLFHFVAFHLAGLILELTLRGKTAK